MVTFQNEDVARIQNDRLNLNEFYGYGFSNEVILNGSEADRI